MFSSLDFGLPYEGQRGSGAWATPAVYQCPTDPIVGREVTGYACNYIGIAGGSLAAEENGVFISGYLGEVSPASITDGLSNTIAMTESRSYSSRAPRSAGRLSHSTHKTPRRYSLPEGMSDFISECDGPSELPIHGRGLGADWMFGSLGVTRLIAVLPRQSRNCANGGSLSRALLAPTSNHAGGCYAVTASGSVQFLSGSMTAKAWRSLCGASDRQIAFAR